MTENTMMEEEASELMQDISENASDMETDKQKKWERAPKQNMQETLTVTSNTASPEQKKTQNEHQDTSQAPVKALFQASKDPVPSEKHTTKVSNKEAWSNMTQVSMKEDEVPLQDSMNLANQGIPKGATHLGKVKALLAPNLPTTTKVSTDDAATLQNSMNMDDQGTKVNNTSSKTQFWHDDK